MCLSSKNLERCHIVLSVTFVVFVPCVNSVNRIGAGYLISVHSICYIKRTYYFGWLLKIIYGTCIYIYIKSLISSYSTQSIMHSCMKCIEVKAHIKR
jgi:hypothetical protein